MSKDLRNMVVVGSATVGSRVLGLIRDGLVYGMLGVTALNSAFLMAFTLPNLFRRLLGEGALTSALVPIMSDRVGESERKGFIFLNQVCTYTLLVLLFLVVFGMGVLVMVPFVGGLEDRWYMAADMGILLLPYMILVCLAAVLGAALNVIGRFGVSSLSQIWLNISMIFFLGIVGYYFGESGEERVYCLSIGIMVGGLLQVMIPGLRLVGLGWRPCLDLRISNGMRELMGLMLPALMAAGVVQVNIVISRLLAFYINAEAVSVLYLANRLIELPMGVFAISVVTVVFPRLAQVVSSGGSRDDLGDDYGKGMRMILAIMVPAMVGLIILREPILRILFEWGRFSESDVRQTGAVLMMLAVGLPFYSMITYTVRGFHAIRDMRTPFYVSLGALVCNVVLSVLLMQVYGMYGLVLSNVLVAVMQASAQHMLLMRKGVGFEVARWKAALIRVLLAAGVMGCVTELSWYWVKMVLGEGKAGSLVVVCLAIPISVMTYFILLKRMGYEDWAEVKGLLKRQKEVC